jgi:pimeloyl-ACP methyl ester carboxylesterase
MADAVVAVHDAADIDAAHTVAVSKGGLITVDLVSRFPERVVSATSIVAMSPDPAAGIGPEFLTALDSETQPR